MGIITVLPDRGSDGEEKKYDKKCLGCLEELVLQTIKMLEIDGNVQTS